MKTLLLFLMLLGVSTVEAQENSSNCPLVEQTVQSFCESEGTGNNFYRPAVKHLQAATNGAEIAWYESSESSTPLSADDFLVDGKDYFAGNVNNTCLDRQAVSVHVYNAPNAGATTSVTFCSNDDPIDLLEIYKPSILGPPDDGGTFTPALASGTTVFDPSEDLAGTYKYTVLSLNGECPNDDSIIYIKIDNAPNAGENGEAKLKNSDAPVNLLDYLGGTPDEEGIWAPALKSGTGVFDPSLDEAGTYIYTVAGGSNCEEAIASVVVSVASDDPPTQNCPLVEQTVQSFCASEGTGNNFYRPAVKHLQATTNGAEIAWYDSSEASTPLSPDEFLVDGKEYFAGNVNGTCLDRQVVNVIIDTAPNAGATTSVTFCSTDDPIDLLEIYRPSILGPPDGGGTFSPALASGTTVFDPSEDSAGTYRYTVSSPNDECPDDDSVIYITIEDCEVNDGLDLNVYPNPSTGVFNFSGNFEKIIIVKLYDNRGKMLKVFPPRGNKGVESINLSEFETGIYFAEVKTEKGVKTKRLIKI